MLAVDETDSTNHLASSLARRGAPHGSIVFAELQHGGRGRWNRRWESPRGGLYLSMVLRPTEETAPALGVLPLTASVAAAEALKATAGVDCELSWPNDLFARGRKIAGVLCESSFTGSRCDFAIMGIGVNVDTRTTDMNPEVARRAISLREVAACDAEPEAIGLGIVLALERWWEGEEPSRALERWRELARGLEGDRIRVVPRGAESYDAWTAGLAEDGGLRVRLEDGTHRVLHSDDVHRVGHD
ncbi:MAG: biotin--[acetyl-CoA-carboxylase] ligase [Vicinamibacteria bacterium]